MLSYKDNERRIMQIDLTQEEALELGSLILRHYEDGPIALFAVKLGEESEIILDISDD